MQVRDDALKVFLLGKRMLGLVRGNAFVNLNSQHHNALFGSLCRRIPLLHTLTATFQAQLHNRYTLKEVKKYDNTARSNKVRNVGEAVCKSLATQSAHQSKLSRSFSRPATSTRPFATFVKE
eukprot:1062980-Amphidinium_carterae.2